MLDSKCHFLETILIEIRFKIYKYLLINPILGEPDSIFTDVSFGNGSKIKYGLAPGVLGKCHQIYVEASSVLHGQNTILIACVETDRLNGQYNWTTEREHYINL
jgi:hypothetical protein